MVKSRRIDPERIDDVNKARARSLGIPLDPTEIAEGSFVFKEIDEREYLIVNDRGTLRYFSEVDWYSLLPVQDELLRSLMKPPTPVD